MPQYEHEQNRPLSLRRSGAAQLTPEQKQRRQMLMALGLLLCALVLVIARDKSFWFPPEQVAQAPLAPLPAKVVAQAPSSATKTIAHKATKIIPKPAITIADASAPLAPVVTNRAILPPLEIQVIAGNRHQPVQDKNNSVGLDMGSAGSSEPATTPTTSDVVSNASQSASERVQLSTDTAQVVTHPVEPNYPLLAKEMKVQGSVVLEAMIGKDGKIQDLRTVSGPSILSSAAREAVQQWRFKPYYQAGQAVETVAKITVNFTISAN
ncbi:MAG TPA: TonB family protein [Terriglobales bacterium]|jgi:protein TonB